MVAQLHRIATYRRVSISSRRSDPDPDSSRRRRRRRDAEETKRLRAQDLGHLRVWESVDRDGRRRDALTDTGHGHWSVGGECEL